MALTAREQLIGLMAAIEVDQTSAIQDLNAYLNSAEAVRFRATVENIQKRTVPNGHQDQVLTGFLQVFNAVVGVTKAEVDRAMTLASVSDIKPDAPIVVPVQAPLPSDLPLPVELPVQVELVSLIYPDTATGEVV